ncbi:hypothetical protein BLOT_004278 [Blomia tropicalis]|nr:hypothetical protein BLOT_004278 [Blomia tropicalis]
MKFYYGFIAILLALLAVSEETDLKLAVNDDANICEDPFGYYPHENCWQFYQCSHGKPYVHTCPDGTQWNQSIPVCVHITTCDRPSEETTTTGIETTTDAPDEPTTSVAETTTEVSEESTTTKSDEELNCSNSDYLPHENCWQFYQCAHGEPVEMTCPDGTQWNQSIPVCVHITTCDRPSEETTTESTEEPTTPELEVTTTETSESTTISEVEPTSTEPESTTSKPEEELNCSNSDYLPHENCWQFYQCAHGEPVEMTCPDGTQWNQTIPVCVHITTCDRPSKEPTTTESEATTTEIPEETTTTETPEETTTSQPETTTDVSEESTTTKSDEELNCSNSDYLPHENCWQFYQCAHGEPVEMTCPDGTQWNQTIPVCVHITTCDRPSEEPTTTESEATTTEIPEETTTTETPEETTTSQPETTTTDVSEESTTTKSDEELNCSNSDYLPHENCWQFYQCANGKPVEMTCPDGTQWNQSIPVCVHITTCDRPSEEPTTTESEATTTEIPEETTTTETPEETTTSQPETTTTEVSEESTTSKPEEELNCSNSDYLPHENCWQFYQCANGEPVEMTCPDGTQWNQSIPVCVHITTCDRPSEEPTTTETPEENTTTSQPETTTTETSEDTTTTEPEVSTTETPEENTTTETCDRPSEEPTTTETPEENTTTSQPETTTTETSEDSTTTEPEVSTTETPEENTTTSQPETTTIETPEETTTSEPEATTTETPEESTTSKPETTTTEASKESTTSKPEEELNCSNSDYLPHKNCWQFYQCSNGVPVEMTCADGTQWDQSIPVCVHITTCKRPVTSSTTTEKPSTSTTTTTKRPTTTTKKPTTTTKRPTTTTKKPTTTTKRPTTTTKKPTTTTKRPTTTTKKPTTTTKRPTTTTKKPTTTTKRPTTPSGSKFKCPSRFGYFEHEDCWKFWQCSNYIAYEMPCAPFTQWDQRIKTCNHLTDCKRPLLSSKLPSLLPSKSDFECPYRYGVFDHQDCWKFWRCDDYEVRETHCPPFTQWDTRIRACRRLTDCTRPNMPTNQPTSTTKRSNSTTSRPTLPSESNFECPYRYGVFEHEDCWKFWRCINFVAKETTCPPFTQWDQRIRNCRHLTDCRRPSIPTKRPTTTTRRPTSPSESNFECPHRYGVFEHQDCWKFWRCDNFKAIETSCPPFTQWDQRITSCRHLTDCRRPSIPTKQPTTTTKRPTTTTTTKRPTTTTRRPTSPSESNFECPYRYGVFEHQDCWKFWRCDNFKAIETSCPPFTQWDQRITSCRHLTDCNRPQLSWPY